MIRVEFSLEIIEKLEYERYHHPSPKVQKKMEALYLKSTGMLHKKICRICRITKTPLAAYLRQYMDGGVEGLKQLGYKGQPSVLHQHELTLEAHFRKNLPRTIAEARAVIEELTGIKRSPTQVRAFLKQLGMKCCKIGHRDDPVPMHSRGVVNLQFEEPEIFCTSYRSSLKKRVKGLREGDGCGSIRQIDHDLYSFKLIEMIH